MFGFLLNWMAGDWAQKTSPPRYILPEASNLVKGFEKCGYETIGIGGVSWFNDIYETTDLWAREYFQQFYWREHFTPSSDDAFEYQITEVLFVPDTLSPPPLTPPSDETADGSAKRLKAAVLLPQHSICPLSVPARHQ